MQDEALTKPSRRCGPQRGFTMVELLAVVAMIGVLAALALVGYRRFLNAAHTGDAKAIIGGIRVAQENYRAETLSYLDCSATLNDFYPAVPNGIKRHWKNASNTQYDCWQMLNVTTDSATSFGFALVSGAPGEVPPDPSTIIKPTWPTTTEPWYVIQAAGDADKDGDFSYFVASSFNGDILVENESE